MCQVIEELLKEEREETTAVVTAEVTKDAKEAIAEQMLRDKEFPLEETAKYCILSLDEGKALQATSAI